MGRGTKINIGIKGNRAAWKNTPLLPSSLVVLEDMAGTIRAFLDQSPWMPSPDSSLELFRLHCKEHGILGVCGHLVNQGLLDETVAPGIGGEEYITNIMHHHRHKNLLLELAPLFTELRIPYVVVKGPALVDTVYPDEGIRNYGDIDIIVGAKEDVDLLLTHPWFTGKKVKAVHTPNCLFHPGRVHVTVDGHLVEFVYPIAAICDPMFDYLQQHQTILLQNGQDIGYRIAEVNHHFVFLLLHLQKHLCTRMIWHLDLLLYIRKFADILDKPFIERELSRLQLVQFTQKLLSFYRRTFDVDLPLFINHHEPGGWNSGIIDKIASVEHLHGHVGVKMYKSFPVTASIVTGVRFFLISDPQHQRPGRHASGAIWAASLLLQKIHMASSTTVRILAFVFLCMKPVLAPIARYVILRRYRLYFTNQ